MTQFAWQSLLDPMIQKTISILGCMMSKICGHPTYKEAKIQRDQIKSPFSLSAVVMLYKVNRNTKLANAKLLLLGEIQS